VADTTRHADSRRFVARLGRLIYRLMIFVGVILIFEAAL
jgi:hypothetical protein